MIRFHGCSPCFLQSKGSLVSSSVGLMAGPDVKVPRRYDPTSRFAPVLFGQHVVVKKRWRPAGAGRIHDTQLLAGIRFITIKSVSLIFGHGVCPLLGTEPIVSRAASIMNHRITRKPDVAIREGSSLGLMLPLGFRALREIGLVLCSLLLFPSLGLSEFEATDSPVPMTVELASGRRFVARADPRTDTERLWLRWGEEDATVLRPIQWSRVVRAQVGPAWLTGPQLREAVAALRKVFPRQKPTANFGKIQLIGIEEDFSNRSPARKTPEDGLTRLPVRSLAVDAWVANWDSDVEVDGLVVAVFPLDAQGRLVPVEGNLRVELIGRPPRSPRRENPYTRLGSWTRRVHSEAIGPRGAQLRLPFQAFHPESRPEAEPYGAVHVRLTVAGRGTFEATATDVRIRPYSAVRDRLQQATGRRFFPSELTTRTD